MNSNFFLNDSQKSADKKQLQPNPDCFYAHHAGLQEFAENIWIVEGPEVRDMGFLFSTRMTIIKLADGSLWLDSPVPISFNMIQEITGLGPIKYLVAATPRHVWRLSGWHTLFPEAQLWASKPTLLTLQKEKLPFNGFLDDQPPAGWSQDLEQHFFKGNPFSSEVFFFHPKARTLILDDLFQIPSKNNNKRTRNLLMKLEGVTPPFGGVGLDIRLTFFNRKLARQSLDKVLSWDFDRLILAHGLCITKDAKSFIERAFGWLKH